ACLFAIHSASAQSRQPRPSLVKQESITSASDYRRDSAPEWPEGCPARGGIRYSMVSRDSLDAFGHQVPRRRMADVAKRNDADHPLALVDDRQPADFQLLHVLHSLGEIIVLRAAMDAFAHDIACRRAARIEAVLRQSITDNVAVGHHADELVVLSDRNGANVMLTHELGDLHEWRLRTDPLDALVHHFLDFHGGPPVLGAALPQPGPNPMQSEYISDRARRQPDSMRLYGQRQSPGRPG